MKAPAMKCLFPALALLSAFAYDLAALQAIACKAARS